MKNFTKKIVAVIDDEKSLTDMYTEMLTPEYEVVAFNHPKDFLEYLNVHMDFPFDALISDFKMPTMSGLEMIAEAQRKGFIFPFLLFSGYLDKKVILDAVNAGAYRLLEKPAQAEAMIQALTDVINEAQSRKIRHDIRVSIDQLREYYSALSALLSHYIPTTELEKLVVEVDSQGKVVNHTHGERLLNQLEAHLDELLSEEEDLEKTREKAMKLKAQSRAS